MINKDTILRDYPKGTRVKDAYNREGIVPNIEDIHIEETFTAYFYKGSRRIYLYSMVQEKWATIIEETNPKIWF